MAFSSVRRRAGASVAAILILAGLLATPGAVAGATIVSGTPAQLLARLRVAPEHRGGYARSLFVHWIDADGDGCDTRREVLIAESRTPVTVGSGCALSGGLWRSAYDGMTTSVASRFDIDHVVPLKEAWDSGAWRWTAATRRAYANDLGDARSLRAVSAASNREKSDRDPAQWMPPRTAFRCTYVNDWIAVKVRWRLSVDGAELRTLRAKVGACPVVRLRVALASITLRSATSADSGGATSSASGGCDPNYAGYCVPITTTDLDCPDIGHRVTVIGVDLHRLDGDGDGIGCESYPA